MLKGWENFLCNQKWSGWNICEVNLDLSVEKKRTLSGDATGVG